MNQHQKLSISVQDMMIHQMLGKTGFKGPACYYPSKLKTTCSMDRKNSSPQGQYNSQDFLNYVSPFSPYLQSKNSLDESQSLTDRYIPSRKLLKKQSLLKQQQQGQNDQNEGIRDEMRSTCVADIYRKMMMIQNMGSLQGNGIQVYQNTNIFKYGNKNVLKDLGFPIVSKNSSFQFTEELINNRKKRKIGKFPIKVLDAPLLQDDYYLNLIDWSNQNFLAVGLCSSVYLWNASNTKVSKLCDLGVNDTVTSVSWSLKGPYFSMGTNIGQVQIWDVNKVKKIRSMNGHSQRVSAIAWNSNIMSTGSKDKLILHRDIRCSSCYQSKLVGHKQEVCGLKWSPDQQQLCSGGNDNKLMIWSVRNTEPIMKFSDHVAAVKAMAWSPHQHGLLISGGGTADRTIRFRNTLTGVTTKVIDAGSQVCNLMFSKSLNEIVSTHGYSQNEINIWKLPRMEKICSLTGHTTRVLYLAMSPDGSTIVTGAGDETLRFWNIFPSKNEAGKKVSSLLNVQNILIR